MKKKLSFTVFFIFILISFSFAQTKVDRYCQVSIDPKNGFTSKTTASISFGQIDSLFFFRDSSIIEKLKKVNEMSTPTDVLNYMSNLGFTLVSVIPFGQFTIHERLFFRKTFEVADLGVQN